MKMDPQHMREYPPAENPYSEKIRPHEFSRPPNYWKRTAIVSLIAVLILALILVIVVIQPRPDPLKQGGTWQGPFMYNTNAPIPYSGSFQGTLTIPANQGIVAGTLFEPLYENTTVSVTGTEGSSSQFRQDQLPYVTQLYNHGTGTFVEFTDPSYIQGNQIELNCTYIAAVYPDGSLRGVWFYPGYTQPAGSFILTKTA